MVVDQFKILQNTFPQLDTAYEALIWFGEEYLDTALLDPPLKLTKDNKLIREIPVQDWTAMTLLYRTITDLLGNSLDVIKGVHGYSGDWTAKALRFMADANQKNIEED